MYIPKQMKTVIADVFYDKIIDVLVSVTITDSEGGVNNKGYDVVDSFNGNVNFSNCKQIQEDYGLDYKIDVVITTNYDLLKINDIIKYQNVTYKVNDIRPTDSHNTIVATIWRQ